MYHCIIVGFPWWNDARQVLDPDAIEALVDALDMDHSGSVPCPMNLAFCSVL